MMSLAHNVHICIGNPQTSREAVFDLFHSWGFSLGDSQHIIQQYDTFSIEHARDLKHFVSVKNPHDGISCVCIFTDHILLPAQSVLLKTFEELDSNICLCFVIPFEHVLLPALRSRVFMHYLKKTKTSSPIDVELFYLSGASKRLLLLDSFFKKHKDSSAEEVQRETRNFLDAYEEYVYGLGDIYKLRHVFESLYFVKEYAPDKSSSPKQLLEYVALH